VDISGKKLFSVYLIHSLALEMSAIQLFVGDKMAVVAHLVGKDTVGPMFVKDVRNCFNAAWGAVHQFLRIIINLRILVLLPVSTLPYVVRVKNSS
jgi:hypothetical protein